MNKQLEQDNYLLIDNFISPERASELFNTYKSHVEQYPHLFDKDSQCPLSYAMYNFRDFLNLLCESEHWRDKFTGQEYIQVFLHYVRGTGEHWEHFGDRINAGLNPQ